jgi:hypothetical protein
MATLLKLFVVLGAALTGIGLGTTQVIFELHKIADRRVMLTLFHNGASENGVDVMLPLNLCSGGSSDQQHEQLVMWAAQAIGEPSETCSYFKLFDETGGLVQNCDDVVSLTSRMSSARLSLYVVPIGKWFVFPTVELGRSVPITRVHSPRGVDHPITVETISHSPRVFHLHNFITESG